MSREQETEADELGLEIMVQLHSVCATISSLVYLSGACLGKRSFVWSLSWQSPADFLSFEKPSRVRVCTVRNKDVNVVLMPHYACRPGRATTYGRQQVRATRLILYIIYMYYYLFICSELFIIVYYIVFCDTHF